VKDNNACPVTIDASGTNSTDGGNNTCWTFAAAGGSITVSSNENQTFAYAQATTGISILTLTDNVTPTITAANDIRIKISSSTVRMLFDTTDVTATFGGTASAKVSNPVSYEGAGSILVIPVSSDFSASDTLTISDLSFSQFLSANAAIPALAVRVAGVGTTTSSTDDKTVTITGVMTLADHTTGQVADNFDFPSESDVELFAFALTPVAESIDLSSIIFRLLGVRAVDTADITNARLYRDINANKVYDAGEPAVAGSGVVAISGQTGTITFSTAFGATTTQNYVLVVDVLNLTTTNALQVALLTTDMTSTGSTSVATIVETGSVSIIQHIKGSGGAGGASAAIGGAPPAGDGVRSGGGQGGGGADPDSGDSIGNEVGFYAPTTNSGSFTNGGNAYSSDGSYATAASTLTHTYATYSFNVPNNNTITGIELKLEASASTNAGTLSARISWDNGSSYTALKNTQTVSTTDAVYYLGGPSDTWGHSWTPAETADGTFLLEVTATPSSNTVSLDALQVRVYHQATGGGGGGGGAVFKKPNVYYANVYEAIGPEIKKVLEGIVGWFTQN
jgi:hypothetical protein